MHIGPDVSSISGTAEIAKVPNARQSLRLRSIPEPHAGQIQVTIHSTAVNPADWKIYEFGLFVTVFPTVLGADAAGEVTKVGPGVTRFKIGDRVFFQGQLNCQSDISNGDKATFQQFCLVDVDLAANIPENIDYDSACTVPVRAVAAAVVLYDLSLGLTAPWAARGEDFYKGQTIVIFGGSSVRLRASSLCGRRYFFAGYSKQALDVLQRGGKLVLVLRAQQQTLLLAEEKQIQVIGAHGASHLYPEFNKGFWSAVEGYLARGVLRPNKTRVLPGGLNAWKDAYELHGQGKVSGVKVVLRPEETVTDPNVIDRGEL